MNRGNRQNARRLMPLRLAPRIVSVSTDDDVWKRLRGELFQLRFLMFRLRFHVVEGLHYMVEAVSLETPAGCFAELQAQSDC